MPLVSKLVNGYRSLFRRTRLDRDLDDELASFLEGLIEKKVGEGLSPDAARRAALIEVGGLEHVKAEVRDQRVGRVIEATAQDLRYAWRGLVRSPAFAAAVLLTLAAGIGANVAVFSVVRAILLKPLPFRDANRLVFIWSDMSRAGYPRAPLSAQELKDLRTRTTLFDGFGAIWSNTASLSGDGDPEQLRVGLVTPEFFSVLGAEPLLGRSFRGDDEFVGPSASIVLSWAVWQRRYGGAPSVIGRRIIVNDQPVTVVGVMPAGFRLFMPPDASVPDDLQAWLPLNRRLVNGPRGQQFLRVIGRMRPSVTLDAAGQEVSSIAHQISREFPEYGSDGRVFNVVGLHADDVREIRSPLLGLFAGVAILLLIACLNVAALLIARAIARTREFAVRTALGAGRMRLLRQCLAEGLLLAALGGLISLAVGDRALALLLALRPSTLDRIAGARMDGSVLAFAAAVTLGWGLLCALSPLAEIWRTDVTGLFGQANRTAAGRAGSRLRAALVTMQVAFCVVLLAGAGLLLRTFVNLQRVEPGFRDNGALTFRVALAAARYPTAASRNAFARQLDAELLSLPNVARVGAISHLPYDDLPNWGGPYAPIPARTDATLPVADYRAVTPDLFAALGVRMIEGRSFTEADDFSRQPVAIIDDLLASRTWPGEPAVGKALTVDPGSSGRPTTAVTVVGVVHHLRLRSLADPLNEQVYFPERQVLRNPMAYVVTGGDPTTLGDAIRARVAHLDSLLPIYDIRPLRDYTIEARATERFTTLLATSFAAIAALLAAIGVYGVMTYAVYRRRREFGVRLALGASPGQLMRLVLKEGAGLTGLGVAIGIGATAWTSTLLRAQLYGVTARDPSTLLTSVLLLMIIALAACWIAARRAVSASPLDVLRSE